MGNVTTVGLDLAKNVFQVHGVDAEGTAVVRQRLTRSASSEHATPSTVVLRASAKLMPICATERMSGSGRRPNGRGWRLVGRKRPVMVSAQAGR